MSKYKSDREFTNFVHEHLAMKQIYPKLKWRIIPKNDSSEYLDVHEGIDYSFNDDDQNIITVQERFREAKYSHYNDFTLRYRRDYNRHDSRKESEFYKIKANYHVYGIIDTSKNNYQNATNFIKFVVIDLKKIFNLISEKKIIIENRNDIRCIIEKNSLICPVNHNRDGSSSFVPFDILLLHKLFEDELFILQKGYF